MVEMRAVVGKREGTMAYVCCLGGGKRNAARSAALISAAVIAGAAQAASKPVLAASAAQAAPPAPKPSEWGYKQDNGPAKWGSMGFPMCSSGRSQSPIQIFPDETTEATGKIGEVVDYPPEAISFSMKLIKSNPHYFCPETKGSACGVITAQGKTYELKQLHFHSPSENMVGNYKGDLEVHLVHVEPDTQEKAVVGLIFRGVEKTASKTGNTMHNLLTIKDDGSEVILTPIRAMPSAKAGYYTWSGSLTTPNCAEEVTWILYDTIYEVPMDAIKNLLKFTQGGNARPVQPINGRTVLHAR